MPRDLVVHDGHADGDGFAEDEIGGTLEGAVEGVLSGAEPLVIIPELAQVLARPHLLGRLCVLTRAPRVRSRGGLPRPIGFGVLRGRVSPVIVTSSTVSGIFVQSWLIRFESARIASKIRSKNQLSPVESNELGFTRRA